MAKWIAISRTEHANMRWQPREGYEFAAGEQVVAVMLGELNKIIPHYAIGFVKAKDESYQVVALLGVGGARNLYTTPDSKWLCGYVPASLRAYPFSLCNGPAEQRVFCIEQSFLTDNISQPRLFNDDGSLVTQVSNTLNFLSQCDLSLAATRKACAALAEAGVIDFWPISFNRSGGQPPLEVRGMYTINEEALNNLDAESLFKLQKSGAVALAYAQLFSRSQLDQLTQRENYLAKTKAQDAEDLGINDLFSNDNAGTLNFDVFNT